MLENIQSKFFKSEQLNKDRNKFLHDTKTLTNTFFFIIDGFLLGGICPRGAISAYHN
jgi:hypothetical protein